MKDCNLGPWGQDKSDSKKNLTHLKCLIILAGKSSTGKSTTLVDLGELLRSEASSSFYEHKNQSNSHDRQIVVCYKRADVGIGTAGDTNNLADENIAFFLWQKCRIGILAANTSGKDKVDAHIEKWAKDNGVPCVTLHKPDFQTELGRKAIQVACIEAIKRSLYNCSPIKKIVNAIKSEDAAIAKMI